MPSQLESLNQLLAAILPANAFYHHKFGTLPEFTSLADFTNKVPFTTNE